MDIEKILNNGGFKTVTGKPKVLEAIAASAGTEKTPLCSGYRIFPDGNRCNGCNDCEPIKFFEVGKYYKHNSGGVIHIVGAVQTTLYGWTLVAEEHGESNLKPVGQGAGHTQNWKETTREVWESGFSK